MGKLVKRDKVIRLPLILEAVFGVLQAAEKNLGTGWKRPCMSRAVVFSAGTRPRVIGKGFVNQFRKLREGLTNYQPLIMRYVYLS